MKVLRRMREPTPPFFQKLRNLGLLLAALGTTLLTAPVTLPVVVVKAAGYFLVAGSVAGVVSQAATGSEISKTKADG